VGKQPFTGPLLRGKLASVQRAIWSGSIAFGLVNAPVRMYPAIDEHDVELHLVHAKDGSRIGYQKYCKAENEPVPDKEIAKAYEVDGDLVLLDDVDFEAAQGESYKTIEIADFVPYEQIDPIYFERTYYLGPQDGSEKVYALLVEALQESGLAGIVRYVFRDRDQLGCLRVREDVLAIERMYFADEIRPADDLSPRRSRKVDPRELELALSLIERITSDFDPKKYKDEYTERLLEVIERKRRGRTVKPRPREETEAPPDLLTALQESVAQASRRGGQRSNGRARDGKPGARSREPELAKLSVKELATRARKLGVEGRSKMTKRELVSAIEKAQR
jgi:DNA end-binding protein Ku